MTDGRFGASEEVVEDGDLMAEEHKAVDQVRADETGATGDENALALGRREELDGREAGEGGVGDRLAVGMEDGLGLVGGVRAGELRVLDLLLLDVLVLFGVGGDDVVRAEIEGAEDVEGDFAVEAEPLEADSVYDIAVLVEGADLEIRL